jgi:phage portal protein BeeE
LTTDKSLTDEQLKRLKAEMNASYTGASNAYKTMILGGGLKPEDISYSNKDMQFLDQLEWYRDKLMIGFGNTKASLGMIDDVNRASHESSLVEWKRNTVQPDMNAIVNTLNEFLVPEFGTNLVLGYCDPVPEDRTDDVSEAQTLYAAGVMTLNEARALIDLEEIEGGETVKQPVVPNFGQGDNNAPTD